MYQNDAERKFASRLLYLPVSKEGRVELWLTLRDQKPVSAIRLRKCFDGQTKGIKRLLKWLSDTRLEYVVDPKNNTVLHISKNKNLAKRTAIILWSEKKKHIIEKGTLFGYPKNVTKIYASFIDEKKWPGKSGALRVITKKSKNFPHYWAPYIRYVLRSAHAFQDSLIAKKWADIIRKEVPKLGYWYENELKNSPIR